MAYFVIMAICQDRVSKWKLLLVCTGAEISVCEADSIDDTNYTLSKYAYLIDFTGILSFYG
jgi:hypothetical protein